MHLLIDNYDSFTYNVVQIVARLGHEIEVYRNDEIELDGAIALNPTSLIVSPGPGGPEDAGISKALIQHFADRIPVLGICLGHQCIVEVFGGTIVQAEHIMHGKVSAIYHDRRTIYEGLPNPFTATRYNSLIADKKTLPAELAITAHTQDGEIMGVRVKDRQVEGVQFHPESILTTDGIRLLANYVAITESHKKVKV